MQLNGSPLGMWQDNRQIEKTNKHESVVIWKHKQKYGLFKLNDSEKT